MDQQHQDPATPRADLGEDEASNRNDARDSLFLMAEFRVSGEDASPVRVRNLSAGGLMADYEDGLDIDLPVELNVRGIGWISGRIAWSAAGRVGVAFDRPIDPMRARKPVGAGSAKVQRKP